MNSVLFRTVTRLVVPLTLLLAIFLFLRGHNAPGGGFIAGLVAAAAWVLHLQAVGPAEARAALPLAPVPLAAAGVLVAILAGLLPAAAGLPLLTGLWWQPAGGPALGTPLLFDLGVFLAVLGTVLAVAVALEEEG